MKLKIIVLVLVAFFTLAFACAPIVSAEGEITTTIEETLTTTQSALETEIDYQLERVKTMIASGVAAMGGTGAVAGAILAFTNKKRKQIDTSIATAKKGYDDAKENADKIIKSTASDVTEMKASADKFQASAQAKIDASMAKLDATAAKVEAMQKAYQEREARMAALLKAELADVKVDGAALAGMADGIMPEVLPVGKE